MNPLYRFILQQDQIKRNAPNRNILQNRNSGYLSCRYKGACVTGAFLIFVFTPKVLFLCGRVRANKQELHIFLNLCKYFIEPYALIIALSVPN